MFILLHEIMNITIIDYTTINKVPQIVQNYRTQYDYFT